MALLRRCVCSCLDVCLVDIVDHINICLVLVVGLDTGVVNVGSNCKVLVLGPILLIINDWLFELALTFCLGLQ